MPVTLDQILTSTRGRTGRACAPGGRRVEREAADAAPAALARGGAAGRAVAVIAEVKRRSPSAGCIRDDLDPAERAARYAAAGGGGDLGAHRRAVLRWIGRRSPRRRRADDGARPPQGLHPRRAADRRGPGRGRRGGAAHRPGAAAGPAARAARAAPRPSDSTRWSRCTPRPSSTPRPRGRRTASSASTAGTSTPFGSTRRPRGDSSAICPASAWPWRRAAWATPADVESPRAQAPTPCSSAPRSPPPPIRRRCWASSSRSAAVAGSAGRLRVKICGLTRPEDAGHGRGGGAAYLGVVFAGGPQARQRRARRPRSSGRGGGRARLRRLSASQSVEEILRAEPRGRPRRRAAPRALSPGRRPPGSARRGLVVWRVVRIAAPGDLDSLAEAALDADAVLVEPRVAARGGRQRRFARPGRGARGPEPAGRVPRWCWPAGSRRRRSRAAVALVRPEVVDVSSGVERLPGIKDPDKIARFLEAVFGHSPIS